MTRKKREGKEKKTRNANLPFFYNRKFSLWNFDDSRWFSFPLSIRPRDSAAKSSKFLTGKRTKKKAKRRNKNKTADNMSSNQTVYACWIVLISSPFNLTTDSTCPFKVFNSLNLFRIANQITQCLLFSVG